MAGEGCNADALGYKVGAVDAPPMSLPRLPLKQSSFYTCIFFHVHYYKNNLNNLTLMKMLKSKKLLGFTLIELLIVIAIIGILAVAFLPALLGAPSKGRDAQRLTSIQKIENFLVTEILRPGNPLEAIASGCIDPAGAAGTIGALVNDNVPSFGGKFPIDPQSENETTGAVNVCKGQYGYINFEINTEYTAGAYARVENADNANILCADVQDDADLEVSPAEDLDFTVAANLPCYLVLAQ